MIFLIFFFFPPLISNKGFMLLGWTQTLHPKEAFLSGSTASILCLDYPCVIPVERETYSAFTFEM